MIASGRTQSVAMLFLNGWKARGRSRPGDKLPAGC